MHYFKVCVVCSTRLRGAVCPMSQTNYTKKLPCFQPTATHHNANDVKSSPGRAEIERQGGRIAPYRLSITTSGYWQSNKAYRIPYIGKLRKLTLDRLRRYPADALRCCIGSLVVTDWLLGYGRGPNHQRRLPSRDGFLRSKLDTEALVEGYTICIGRRLHASLETNFRGSPRNMPSRELGALKQAFTGACVNHLKVCTVCSKVQHTPA